MSTGTLDLARTAYSLLASERSDITAEIRTGLVADLCREHLAALVFAVAIAANAIHDCTEIAQATAYLAAERPTT